MAYCPECGKPVDLSDRFCRSCGRQLDASPPAQDSGTSPGTPTLPVTQHGQLVSFGVASVDDWAFEPSFLTEVDETDTFLMVPDGADAAPTGGEAGYRVIPGDRIVWRTDTDGSEPIAVLADGTAQARDELLMQVAQTWFDDDARGLRVVSYGEPGESNWWVWNGELETMKHGYVMVDDDFVSADVDAESRAEWSSTEDRRIAWAYDAIDEEAEAIAVVSDERTGDEPLLLQIAREWAASVEASQVLVRQGNEILRLRMNATQGVQHRTRPRAHAVTQRNSGYAVTSLVLGILGITFIPLLGSILAVYFARKADKEIEESDFSIGGGGYAKAGRTLGYIGLILFLIYVVLIVSLILFAGQNA